MIVPTQFLNEVNLVILLDKEHFILASLKYSMNVWIVNSSLVIVYRTLDQRLRAIPHQWPIVSLARAEGCRWLGAESK